LWNRLKIHAPPRLDNTSWSALVALTGPRAGAANENGTGKLVAPKGTFDGLRKIKTKK